MVKLHVSFLARDRRDMETPYLLFYFCLAEEFLSGVITNLDDNCQLFFFINGSIGNHISVDVLYVDDVLIFCKGTMSCMRAIQNLFTRYICSTHKSL